MDAGGKLSREEIDRSVNFCTNVISKIENGSLSTLPQVDLDDDKPGGERGAAAPAGAARKDERVDQAIMKIVKIHRVLDLDSFAADVIDGMAPKMTRGGLGLVTASA
jgi:hypothetical protein